LQLKHKANCQLLFANCFFAHSRDLSGGDVLRKNAAPFQGHTLVHGGRGNWDPNGRPQTTELQAFLGFPPAQSSFPNCGHFRRRSRQCHPHFRRKL